MNKLLTLTCALGAVSLPVLRVSADTPAAPKALPVAAPVAPAGAPAAAPAAAPAPAPAPAPPAATAPAPAPAPAAPASPAATAPAPAPPGPATTAPAPTPEMEPEPPRVELDKDAVAFLDKVAAANKGFAGFAASYASVETHGAKKESTSGTFAYKRPNQIRLEGKLTDGNFQFVLDGKTLVILQPNKQYAKLPVPPVGNIGRVLNALPSAVSKFVAVFSDGINPATLGGGANWSKVSLLPDAPGTLPGTGLQGVAFEAAASPSFNSLVFTLYFDRKDLTLRRGEAKLSTKEGNLVNTTDFTNVVVNPVYPAGKFTFVAPPGTKLAQAPPAAQPTPPSEALYNPKLKKGVKPIAFAAKDIAGKTQTIAAYKGKVLLIDFWATWCGPCVAEMPNVIATYNKYHAKGFEIVGVSLDEKEQKADLLKFIKVNKMPWPQICDFKNFNGAVPTAYGVQAIPFCVLINRKGFIAGVDLRGPALAKAVAAAVAAKP